MPVAFVEFEFSIAKIIVLSIKLPSLMGYPLVSAKLAVQSADHSDWHRAVGTGGGRACAVG